MPSTKKIGGATKHLGLRRDVVTNVKTLLQERGRIRSSFFPATYKEKFGVSFPKGKVSKYATAAGACVEGDDVVWPDVAPVAHGAGKEPRPCVAPVATEKSDAWNRKTEEAAAAAKAKAEQQRLGQEAADAESERQRKAEAGPWPEADFKNSGFKEFFKSKMEADSQNVRNLPALVGEGDAEGVAFLGYVDADRADEEVYLNINSPFTLLTTGLPGGGKSHTINGILEACVVPGFCVQKPMAALVCHFDKTDGHSTLCETVGLLKPVPDSPNPECRLESDKLVVLCSPTNLKNRKQHYQRFDPNIKVLPLYFEWGALRAEEISKLMRLSKDAQQLYVGVMFQKLRAHYGAGKMPPLGKFVKEMLEACSISQRGPAEQRLNLLRSFTTSNAGPKIAHFVRPGTVVIADLSDPFLEPDEANAIFQVLLGQFRKQTNSVGKVVIFDEAHRYMGPNSNSLGGLAEEITSCARMLRHDGMRLLVSTQSPLGIPEELLELASVFVAHRYQSRDWHQYLCKKLRFQDESFDQIGDLQTGHALLYSMCSSFQNHSMQIRIRPRITSDLGGTRRNIESSAVVADEEQRCYSASGGAAK